VSVCAAFLGILLLLGIFSLFYSITGLHLIFGIVFPYAAAAFFIVGILYRILKWASVPVPFHIPTVCGQQKSLPWIKSDGLDSPTDTAGVFKRMALEILFFRSLFLNEKFRLSEKKNIYFWGGKLLWLGGIAFHWALFFILLRHMRLFTEPVPALITTLRSLDGFFQWTWWPGLFITDAMILFALIYLLLRRLRQPQLRFISLPSDFFPLFLILGVVLSGVLMRLFINVDVVRVKELAIGLISLNPPLKIDSIGWPFYLHLFFVCILFAYFPYSKLMHGLGVFFSPTRNLKNNSRAVRHINPLDMPVKVHGYEAWEDEFRDKIIKAGLPLDKE
jgi:nitrate reductase gamma subunit